MATFFGIGFCKPGPGTWASGVTLVLWWLLARGIVNSPRAVVCTVLAIVITFVGIAASTRVARESGAGDPGFVVIDEVAGQLFALILTPLRWQYLLASFILFRALDILKPPPIRQLERLPEGTGIMVDDVAAGIGAMGLGFLLVRFHLLG